MKNPEIERRIRDLLGKMTLEEKVGQLHQSGGSLVGAFDLTLEEILTMVQDGRITAKLPPLTTAAFFNLEDDHHYEIASPLWQA